ncbi:hypothetical protein VTK56DRAFT_8753 [Thermocarpiscus australiensis]
MPEVQLHTYGRDGSLELPGERMHGGYHSAPCRSCFLRDIRSVRLSLLSLKTARGRGHTCFPESMCWWWWRRYMRMSLP